MLISLLLAASAPTRGPQDTFDAAILAWFDCLDTQARANVAKDLPINDAADAAMAQCRGEENDLKEQWVVRMSGNGKRDPVAVRKRVNADWPQIRAEARDLALASAADAK